MSPPVPVVHPRLGLASIARGQLAPRVSMRPPISMGEMPERAAATHGRIPISLDRPLEIDPEQRLELDYVSFADLVVRASAALAEAGVRPWDRVAIAKSAGFDTIALAWAAARIGAIPALLSPGLDPEILDVLLTRLEAPFVYLDEPLRRRLDPRADGWSARATLLGSAEGAAPLDLTIARPVPEATPRRGGEPMLITHTSSTTGISKLVENSVAGTCFTARIEAGTPFGHSPAELAASCISFVHVRSTITTMASLSRGTALLAVSDPSNERVLELFARHRPTAVEAHPNTFVQWERIADHASRPFASIRVFFSTFDAAHPRTIACLLGASSRRLPIWFQAYGQTETQLISFRVYTRRGAARLTERGHSRSAGWPAPGVRVRIVAPGTGRRVPRGEPGCIQVKTPARSLSFVATPDKYWARRDGPWFDTGDWGRVTRRGDVEIFDRVADRIDGVQSCLLLEDVLLDRLPDAEEVVIVPDRDGAPVPVVCMRGDARLDDATWARVAADLPNLRPPVEIAERQLRRTATAKARRYLLTDLVSPPDGASATELLREGA